MLISILLLAGCDLLDKGGDDSQTDTYDVRILTSEGTIIHSETLVDPPLVDLPDVSSSLEAAFEANRLTYEGRDQATYDPTDLLLAFYVDDDGGMALLPSVSGGGGFGCGFPGDEVLEDFDGVIYATSLQSIHPSAMMELPFRAEWVDCENDYEDVSSAFRDTVVIDAATRIIPKERTHTISDLTATGFHRVEVERDSAKDRARPVVVHYDGHHWYATMLEREGDAMFSGAVVSEGMTLHLVFISDPAE